MNSEVSLERNFSLADALVQLFPIVFVVLIIVVIVLIVRTSKERRNQLDRIEEKVDELTK